MAQYPTNDPTDDTLYIAVDNKATALSAGINDSVTTIPVNSAAGFPSIGFITIGEEKIKYTSIDATNFFGATRGAGTTTAAPHSLSDPVTHTTVSDHHNDIKDEVIAMAADLRDTFKVDFNDNVPVTETAGALSSRLDQIVTAHKNAIGESDWKTVPAETLSSLESSKAEDSEVIHDTGNESVAGIKDFTTQIKGKGTATDDDAAAGYIGEYIESIVSPVSITTTATVQDLTSISLSAGDWDLTALFHFVEDTATGYTVCLGFTTLTPGNSFTGLVFGSNGLYTLPGNSSTHTSVSIANYRVKLSGTTTFYLKGYSEFSGGNSKIGGRLSARRVR